MRTKFINRLIEEAKVNDKIFLIVGDLGYHVVEPFAEAFPDRFLNVGIAEQNMAGVAAGLAMTGYNVYVYSIGNFPTLRCLEQIRNDIAYHHANVKIISVGAGYAYGCLGATHQATEDIGAIRVIPNMVVATPGDPIEAETIANLSATYDGPMYIRLGKAGEKTVHTDTLDNLHIGDILPLRENGNATAVIACGSILEKARQAIDEQNLPYDLYSIPFVKPLNKQQLKSIAESHSKGLIVMEEHQKSCGVGSAILEQLSDMYNALELASFPKVKRLAISDEFLQVVGNQNYLRDIAGISL